MLLIALIEANYSSPDFSSKADPWAAIEKYAI